jgi:hypothetical protein
MSVGPTTNAPPLESGDRLSAMEFRNILSGKFTRIVWTGFAFRKANMSH